MFVIQRSFLNPVMSFVFGFKYALFVEMPHFSVDGFYQKQSSLNLYSPRTNTYKYQMHIVGKMCGLNTF